MVVSCFVWVFGCIIYTVTSLRHSRWRVTWEEVRVCAVLLGFLVVWGKLRPREAGSSDSGSSTDLEWKLNLRCGLPLPSSSSFPPLTIPSSSSSSSFWGSVVKNLRIVLFSSAASSLSLSYFWPKDTRLDGANSQHSDTFGFKYDLYSMML